MSDLVDGELSKKPMREHLYGGPAESMNAPQSQSVSGTECGDSHSTDQNSSMEMAAIGIPGPRMLVVLGADELAAAIHKACGMDEARMPVTKFSLETARKALSILPPLYYEPRSS